MSRWHRYVLRWLLRLVASAVVGSLSAPSYNAQRAVVPQNMSTTPLQPEVTFGTLVLHRVSVYITWPSEPACSGGGDSTAVVGYRLRYQATDDASEFIARQLTDHFVLLENVRSNVVYRFQVKYVFAGGSETEWSDDGMVDTRPAQRQTL